MKTLVQLIPAPPGLVAQYDQGESEWFEPVVAFGLYADGAARAMCLTEGGELVIASDGDDFTATHENDADG